MQLLFKLFIGLLFPFTFLTAQDHYKFVYEYNYKYYAEYNPNTNKWDKNIKKKNTYVKVIVDDGFVEIYGNGNLITNNMLQTDISYKEGQYTRYDVFVQDGSVPRVMYFLKNSLQVYSQMPYTQEKPLYTFYNIQ
jgi:hypothetical protein